MTIFNKWEVIKVISLYPAITVLIFLRRRLGYRLLRPTWLSMLALIMMGVAMIFAESAKPFPAALVIYAVAMLFYGHWLRYQRWKELCQGKRWHTLSRGISYFELLPVGPFFQSNSRIYRFLDPLACFIVGFIVALVLSRLLGAWICLSAAALFLFEDASHQMQIERSLDILDSMLLSEIQQQEAEHWSGDKSTPVRRTLDETAGIATGMATDISTQVSKRMAAVQNQSPPAPKPTDLRIPKPAGPPDNLAV